MPSLQTELTIAPPEKAPILPMQPWSNMSDMFRGVSGSEEHKTGAIRIAPYQEDAWFLEPRYAKSVPMLLSTEHKQLFADNGRPIVMTQTSQRLAESVAKLIPGNNWLHCMGLPGVDPSDPDSFALGIMDYIDHDMTYVERRQLLNKVFKPLGFLLAPQDKYFFLIPAYSEEVALNLWFGLRSANGIFKRRVYDGLFCKRGDSKYEKLTATTRPCPWWHEHLFVNPIIFNPPLPPA